MATFRVVLNIEANDMTEEEVKTFVREAVATWEWWQTADGRTPMPTAEISDFEKTS